MDKNQAADVTILMYEVTQRMFRRYSVSTLLRTDAAQVCTLITRSSGIIFVESEAVESDKRANRGWVIPRNSAQSRGQRKTRIRRTHGPSRPMLTATNDLPGETCRFAELRVWLSHDAVLRSD
jgi:hypothetical protein